MFNSFIDTIHHMVHGECNSFIGTLVCGLWNIFSTTNGNPDNGNFGIRFSIGIFFSLFLLVILQLRAKLTLDRKHLVAFVGAIFLLIRYCLMMGFEWGWQINLYDDWMLHFLFPPLEHFFYLLFFGCMAYYSLNTYNYYPGILKKVLVWIPVSITAFFIYSTISWKSYFLTHLPTLSPYMNVDADWENHAIVSVIALYIIMVAIKQYKKYFCFLSAFWTITLIEHVCRAIGFYNKYEPAELATIYHAMALWSLPLLILHFTNAYVLRIGEPKERRRPPWEICDDCVHPEKIEARDAYEQANSSN